MAYSISDAQIIDTPSGKKIWTVMGWAPYTEPTAAESDVAQFGISTEQPAGDTTEGGNVQYDNGEDFYSRAAREYNDNPLSARGSDGGSAWRPADQGVRVSAPWTIGNNFPDARGASGGSMVQMAGGAGPVNYGSTSGQVPQTTRQINDAAHQAALQGASSGTSSGVSQATGQPLRGGSSSIVAGPVPDVGDMSKPYMGGPPGFGSNTQIGAGAMPTTMRDIYSAFIKDPSSMTANPMYKSMMDAGLQAAERGARARGFSGSGNLLTELQDRGAGIAGQFLPTMANMYRGAASDEASRWATENQGLLSGSQFGLNQWQAAANDQLNRAAANYGAGQDQRALIQNLQTQQQYQPLMQQMLLRGY